METGVISVDSPFVFRSSSVEPPKNHASAFGSRTQIKPLCKKKATNLLKFSLMQLSLWKGQSKETPFLQKRIKNKRG